MNTEDTNQMKAELLEHLINIEQIKTVFARNLFHRPCQDYKKHSDEDKGAKKR